MTEGWKTMKILSIGNSFSQDATRYLHQIAASCGEEIFSANLYIGGCPLELHHQNLVNSAADYELWVNGENTEIKVSIQEQLAKENWDYITLQQASRFSVRYDTYQPYLNVLTEFIREHCPGAKLVIHQTWAYEDDSQMLFARGYQKAAEMFADLKDAYEKAVADVQPFGMIPSGDLFRKLLSSGIEKVHRDTFHASLGLGRYALALLWYRFFTQNSVEHVPFCDFDEPISNAEITIVKRCVNEII